MNDLDFNASDYDETDVEDRINLPPEKKDDIFAYLLANPSIDAFSLRDE